MDYQGCKVVENASNAGSIEVRVGILQNEHDKQDESGQVGVQEKIIIFGGAGAKKDHNKSDETNLKGMSEEQLKTIDSKLNVLHNSFYKAVDTEPNQAPRKTSLVVSRKRTLSSNQPGHEGSQISDKESSPSINQIEHHNYPLQESSISNIGPNELHLKSVDERSQRMIHTKNMPSTIMRSINPDSPKRYSISTTNLPQEEYNSPFRVQRRGSDNKPEEQNSSFHSKNNSTSFVKLQQRTSKQQSSRASSTGKIAANISSTQHSRIGDQQYFAQYMDDLVQVMVNPERQNQSKNGRRKSSHNSSVVFHHNRKQFGLIPEQYQSTSSNQFGQIEPKVVSLRLQPQNVQQNQQPGSLSSSMERKEATMNQNQTLQDSQNLFLRSQNSFKPSRVITACKLPGGGGYQPLQKQRSLQYGARRRKNRGKTVSGVKLALQPKPELKLKYQHMSQMRQPSKQAKVVEFGSQTIVAAQDDGIGCQADFEDDQENLVGSNYSSLNKKHSTFYNNRAETSAITEFYASKQAPVSGSVEGVFDQEQMNYDEYAKKNIVSEFQMQEQQNLDSSIKEDSQNDIASSTSQNYQQVNQPRTIVNLQHNQKQESFDDYSYAHNQIQTEQLSTTLHDASHQQQAQFLPETNHETESKNAKPGRNIQCNDINNNYSVMKTVTGSLNSIANTGRTPSPLRTMADFVRQTQEQFGDLPQEELNALAAAELANQAYSSGGIRMSSSKPYSAERKRSAFADSRGSLTRSANKSASKESSKQKRARRLIEKSLQISGRPNTVLGASDVRISANSKFHQQIRFVPRTTMQIKAYELRGSFDAKKIMLQQAASKVPENLKSSYKSVKNKKTLRDSTKLNGTQGTLFLSVSKRNSARPETVIHNVRSNNLSSTQSKKNSLDNGRSSLHGAAEEQQLSDDSNVSDDGFYATHVSHLKAKTVSQTNHLVSVSKEEICIPVKTASNSNEHHIEQLEEENTLRIMKADSIYYTNNQSPTNTIKLQRSQVDDANSIRRHQTAKEHKGNKIQEPKEVNRKKYFASGVSENIKIDDDQTINQNSVHEELYADGNEKSGSPSQGGGSTRKSRTVFSVKGSRKNIHVHEEDNIDKNSNEVSRRSVYLKSFNQEISPKTVQTSAINIIQTELITQLHSTQDLQNSSGPINPTRTASQGEIGKSQQDILPNGLQPQGLENVNLFKSGQLQMLKNKLKSQAYLDDLKYQMNMRQGLQNAQAKDQIKCLINSQQNYLTQFTSGKTKQEPEIGRSSTLDFRRSSHGSQNSQNEKRSSKNKDIAFVISSTDKQEINPVKYTQSYHKSITINPYKSAKQTLEPLSKSDSNDFLTKSAGSHQYLQEAAKVYRPIQVQVKRSNRKLTDFSTWEPKDLPESMSPQIIKRPNKQRNLLRSGGQRETTSYTHCTFQGGSSDGQISTGMKESALIDQSNKSIHKDDNNISKQNIVHKRQRSSQRLKQSPDQEYVNKKQYVKNQKPSSKGVVNKKLSSHIKVQSLIQSQNSETPKSNYKLPKQQSPYRALVLIPVTKDQRPTGSKQYYSIPELSSVIDLPKKQAFDRKVSDPKKVKIYSVYSSHDQTFAQSDKQDAVGADAKSMATFMSQKSSHHMRQVISRGASRGSVQRALQLNLLNQDINRPNTVLSGRDKVIPYTMPSQIQTPNLPVTKDRRKKSGKQPQLYLQKEHKQRMAQSLYTPFSKNGAIKKQQVLSKQDDRNIGTADNSVRDDTKSYNQVRMASPVSRQASTVQNAIDKDIQRKMVDLKSVHDSQQAQQAQQKLQLNRHHSKQILLLNGGMQYKPTTFGSYQALSRGSYRTQQRNTRSEMPIRYTEVNQQAFGRNSATIENRLISQIVENTMSQSNIVHEAYNSGQNQQSEESLPRSSQLQKPTERYSQSVMGHRRALNSSQTSFDQQARKYQFIKLMSGAKKETTSEQQLQMMNHSRDHSSQQWSRQDISTGQNSVSKDQQMALYRSYQTDQPLAIQNSNISSRPLSRIENHFAQKQQRKVHCENIRKQIDTQYKNTETTNNDYLQSQEIQVAKKQQFLKINVLKNHQEAQDQSQGQSRLLSQSNHSDNDQSPQPLQVIVSMQGNNLKTQMLFSQQDEIPSEPYTAMKPKSSQNLLMTNKSDISVCALKQKYSDEPLTSSMGKKIVTSGQNRYGMDNEIAHEVELELSMSSASTGFKKQKSKVARKVQK